ncbi:outer membrane protein assembly factor BamA [Luteimonas sp. SX5]|uniref:Outer membrane protein assembly factor BamA n=1 Tax=Luteimonas galliterrae TaxID=2940486 RepID=A0ABT0ME62_9GAMM|nr:outer membrane protein assembly factor BamA [Luteimonas galliterrae]MCL1633161.1 outer membrane protein assembly factor BamA [Luteimonas galliterrae]
MTRSPTRRLLALALASALSAPAWAQFSATPQTSPVPQSADAFTVTDIRIDGLQRISAGTVFTYLPIERGDTIDQARSAAAIRALYKTGFFEDVSLGRQDGILVVTVVERPAINKLTFTGNKDIKTEDLMKGLKDIGLAEGETFDRMDLDGVTKELVRQYNNRGKYNVEVTPTVSKLDRNRVDVTVAIKEGKAAKIRHINLIGNELFPEEDIRESWESREHNWLSWYKRDDQYSREKLDGDFEKLDQWYLDRGYVDFSRDSAQVSISPDKRDMFVTAGITEGEQYKISDVKVSGDTVLPREQIDKMVYVKPGQIFSRRVLQATTDSITSVLGNIGYAFAQVNPVPDVNRENRTVGIDMQIVPGPRVNVRRIVFKGNTRTADEVLRRQMRQFEGAWYSQAAIDRSKIRLQQLGYFETVDIETPEVPGSSDQVDVVVNVKETTSGSFLFGVGYSQLSGITTSIQLTESNFLGNGNRVSVAAQRSSYQDRYDFSFMNPYFSDNGMALGYNLWWREFDYSDFNVAQYSSKSGAAQAIVSLPITEYDSVSGLLGIDSNEILVDRVFGSTPQEIIDYVDAVGHSTFHAWRAQIGFARDTRNNAIFPSSGTSQRIVLEATLPGSTVEYYKIEYDFSKFWPISQSLILNTRLDLGYGDSYGDDFTRTLPGGRVVTATGLPFFENFYAGGVSSQGRVRGYTDNTLGPRARSFFGTGFPQPIGGSVKTVGSLELYFPKLFDSNAARISAFLDFGNVYRDVDSFDASELRASTGIALLWRSPMGPISISYAFPLRDKPADPITGFPADETERLQFTFSGGL